MTLDEIKPGCECRVVEVTAGGRTGQRLMDMGFVPGARIKVIRNAPLVDPVNIQLRGYNISIRRREAGGVEVEEA